MHHHSNILKYIEILKFVNWKNSQYYQTTILQSDQEQVMKVDKRNDNDAYAVFVNNKVLSSLLLFSKSIVGGYEKYNLLGEKPNKNEDGDPFIFPSLNLSLCVGHERWLTGWNRRQQ